MPVIYDKGVSGAKKLMAKKVDKSFTKTSTKTDGGTGTQSREAMNKKSANRSVYGGPAKQTTYGKGC